PASSLLLHAFPTRRSSDLSLLVSRSSSMREYSICAMANGSLPSISGVLAGVSGFFGGLGSSAPRFIRDADGTRSTAAEPQVGQRSEEHTSELQSPDHLVCR